MTYAAYLAIAAAALLFLHYLRSRIVVVCDYEAGLRLRWGRVVGHLAPGAHLLLPHEMAEIHDMRERAVVLAPQEVTTKDRIPVKATVSLTYKLVAPATARERTTSLEADLYRAGQLALRETLTRFELEALLEARAEASAGVQALIVTEGERLGVEIVRAVVLDVIVRGELKQALADIVKARAEARAKLERARGESAALRSLANAARLLREHGGLYELRLLETAQSAALAASNTLVLGLDHKGLQLGNGKERA